MPGRRLALLVAADEYDDERLPRLAAPVRDAWALAEVLGDDSLGGFDVELLHNETSWAVFRRLEEVLAQRRSADVVLLHFGCHGLKDDSGDLYLAARNTRSELLMSTGIDAAVVTRMMRRSPAGSKVLMLDCCFGGAFARGMLTRAADDLDLAARIVDGTLEGGRGLAVVTASSAWEWAFEVDGSARQGKPSASVFTQALVDGIRSGDADRDQDGKVSLGELYRYVYERVLAARPGQTPGKWEINVQGDLYIARNPRRRVSAGTLPAEMSELVSSPFTGVRVGAVHELAELAAGDSLTLAAAARAALGKLSHDDSRKVSVAALEALAGTEIRLSHTTVDLGLMHVHSATTPSVAAGAVKLIGVPLALASSVSAAPGIQARIDGDRLVITAAPSAPGPVEGTVTVSGPAGDASVQVTGWAAPDPGRFLQDAARIAGTIVGNPAGEALVLTATAWVVAQTGDRQRAVQLLHDAAGLLRAISDPVVRAVVAAARSWALDQVGERASALHELTWAQAQLSDPVGQGWQRSLAELAVSWVGALAGDRDRAGQVLPAAAVAIRYLPDPAVRAACLAGLAWVGWCAGDGDWLGPLLDEAAVIVGGIEGDADERSFALLAIAWVWGQAANPAAATQVLAEIEAAAAGSDDSSNASWFLVLVGWVAYMSGDPGKAQQALADAADAAGRIESDQDRLFALIGVAWVAAQAGASEQASSALAKAETISGKVGSGLGRCLCLAAMAWVAPLMEDGERERRWLDEAQATIATEASRWDQAIGLLVIAWVRAQGGVPDGASLVLKAAVAAYMEADTDADHETWVSLVLVAVAWIGNWVGARNQAMDMLADLKDARKLDDPLMLLTGAAWVAAQAADRKLALELITSATTVARESDEDARWRALALAAAGWVSHGGERHPYETLVRVLQVLVSPHPGTDRTATLLESWTTFCRNVLPWLSTAPGSTGSEHPSH